LSKRRIEGRSFIRKSVSREEREGAKTGAFAGRAREGYEAGMQSEKTLFDSLAA